MALPAPRLWTSGLQNFERRNFCCFQSSSLWYSVTQETNTLTKQDVAECLALAQWAQQQAGVAGRFQWQASDID